MTNFDVNDKNTWTKPLPRFPSNLKPDPAILAAERYGTENMAEIWGAKQTFNYSLVVQGMSSLVLSNLHPDIVPESAAIEIVQKANIDNVDPARIRELEDKTGHDVIAINTSLEEVVSREAAIHINKGKTSADTTCPAKALQIQQSLEVIAISTETLRDILLEKAMLWKDVPHMDTTHLYDALPTVAGRPLVHYAEMLQSSLNLLKYVYNHSVVGKWADVSGNHHSVHALGVDGISLQEEFCKSMGIQHMIAPAQVPGLEFEADIFYLLSRIGETGNNLANYIANGRSDDVNIFIYNNPKKKKGSSAMPHKDAKNGNPTVEEQFMSFRNYTVGNLVTALMNCQMPYARNLAASANSRINFEDGFKFMDHALRLLGNTFYWIDLNKERCVERVTRSYGAVTSQLVMTYLTDQRRTNNPMVRSEAHDLTAKLAKQAWEQKRQFSEVLLENPEITNRLDVETILEITDPTRYVGESKRIIEKVFNAYHHKQTLVTE